MAASSTNHAPPPALPQFCKDSVQRVVSELGRLDVLVNNAAIQHFQGSIESITPEQVGSGAVCVMCMLHECMISQHCSAGEASRRGHGTHACQSRPRRRGDCFKRTRESSKRHAAASAQANMCMCVPLQVTH